jgi:ubiquinone/menaquinone biosynthesis C-methylase UbiE/CTP:phosphocholine cytidylyltransferase-like protein
LKAIILSAKSPEFSTEPVFNLTIGEHSLIDLQISTLRNAGIETIDVVVGHQSERFHRTDVRVIRNTNWKSTGSAGSLAMALTDEPEDVLIVYGDTVFEPRIVADLMKSREDFTACCIIDEKSAFNEKAVVETGYVKRIGADPDSFFVFTGLLMVKASKLQYLRSRINPAQHVGDLVNRAVADGEKIISHIVNTGWMELRSTNALDELRKNAAFLSTIIQIHTDWTQRAKRYDNLDWVNRDVLMNGILDAVRTLRPLRAALDVGTGTGKVMHAIKSLDPSIECWGVDYSEAMLERVKEKEKFTLKVANAEDLNDVPSDYFDLVTARMVFHHINDVLGAAREIRRVLKPGGCFLLCEGNPPSLRTIKWYTEMFRYKEDRNTLTEVDMINILVQSSFTGITTKTILMNNCSLNNWLDNSGIPQDNIDIIKKMHFEADPTVVQDYKMIFRDNECFMEWKFSITYGFKT